MSRYAVRVTGPAGLSRYLVIGGGESILAEAAFTYRDLHNAWGAACHYQRTHSNIVCDVVNLDDEEDKCAI